MIELSERDIRRLEEETPYVHRWPRPKMTEEEFEELKQMVEDYRKRIENEDVCAGGEVQSVSGSQARTNLRPFWRRKVRNDGGSGRTDAGRS